MVTQIDKKQMSEFNEIVSNKLLTTVFQPIVCLKEGKIYAYEALSRITKDNVSFNIQELFQFANDNHREKELDLICRNNAVAEARNKIKSAKLFLNCDVSVISNPYFYQDFAQNILKSNDMKCKDIVFEITEIGMVKQKDAFEKSLKQIRNDDIKLAIDDFGSGFSSIERTCELRPEYVKLDITLVRDIDTVKWKYSVVRTVARICKRCGVKIIAEGIETKEELQVLLSLGIDYGQGYLLAKPSKEICCIRDEIVSLIKKHPKKKNKKYYRMSSTIPFASDILENCKMVQDDCSIISVYNIIKDEPVANHVCVVDKNFKVLGIVKSSDIKAIATRNKNDKKIKDIMNIEFMCVSQQNKIDKISKLAMKRDESLIFDPVVVDDGNGRFVGIITIKNLLSVITNLVN